MEKNDFYFGGIDNFKVSRFFNDFLGIFRNFLELKMGKRGLVTPQGHDDAHKWHSHNTLMHGEVYHERCLLGPKWPTWNLCVVPSKWDRVT